MQVIERAIPPAAYRDVRAVTQGLLDGLEVEDCALQTMPDVSPPKWHLAHTTWFFETFLLEAHVAGYRPVDPTFRELFNSYYQGVGPRHPRAERGFLSRPTLRQVLDYRSHVDAAMGQMLEKANPPRVASLIELGLHHEQQHQELLVMDTKFNLSKNPSLPSHRPRALSVVPAVSDMRFVSFDGGVHLIGHEGSEFAFDNELPRHRRFLEPFELADRCVTNGEWLAFVEAGGYARAGLWLSDGWAWRNEHDIRHPLYWRIDADGRYYEYTCHGETPLDPNAPVCHISGYEATAFAEWFGARLPTEAEWEVAVCSKKLPPSSALKSGGGLESGCWHPRQTGDVWVWTRSAYEPYPGFSPAPGAVGEYNGKFMCSQWVLRGGSCVTPRGHVRPTYRNFFYPHQRWPFTGIRLAKDCPRAEARGQDG